MMKSLFSAAVLLSSLPSFACVQEAEVIAKLQSVTKVGTQSCLAVVQPKGVRFFASSSVCPLDEVEVTSETIEVGVDAEQQCRLSLQDELNGIVSRDSSGQLVLQ